MTLGFVIPSLGILEFSTISFAVYLWTTSHAKCYCIQPLILMKSKAAFEGQITFKFIFNKLLESVQSAPHLKSLSSQLIINFIIRTCFWIVCTIQMGFSLTWLQTLILYDSYFIKIIKNCIKVILYVMYVISCNHVFWLRLIQYVINAITRFGLIAPFFKQLHLAEKVSEDKMFSSTKLGFSHRRSQLKIHELCRCTEEVCPRSWVILFS